MFFSHKIITCNWITQQRVSVLECQWREYEDIQTNTRRHATDTAASTTTISTNTATSKATGSNSTQYY